MPRDPDEKARFRGNDKAYEEGWDRIFGNKTKKENNEQESERPAGDDVALHVEGNNVRHSD